MCMAGLSKSSKTWKIVHKVSRLSASLIKGYLSKTKHEQKPTSNNKKQLKLSSNCLHQTKCKASSVPLSAPLPTFLHISLTCLAPQAGTQCFNLHTLLQCTSLILWIRIRFSDISKCQLLVELGQESSFPICQHSIFPGLWRLPGFKSQP